MQTQVCATDPSARTASRWSSADAWTALEDAAKTHRALTHPYLQRLAAGDLPDHTWALRDFAEQYRGYAREFRRYLRTVIGQLSRAEHRDALTENLVEESGRYGPGERQALCDAGLEVEWFDGIAHPELFARFAGAVGARPDVEAESLGHRWSEAFADLLQRSGPIGALGAMGLGTENIVSVIYVPLIVACRHAGLSERDITFFTLHAMVDDEHQATLRQISLEAADSPARFERLRAGMEAALDLRAEVWDHLLERALDRAPRPLPERR